MDGPGSYVADATEGIEKLQCQLPPAEGLFEREILLDCGRSMLKRFQMNGGIS